LENGLPAGFVGEVAKSQQQITSVDFLRIAKHGIGCGQASSSLGLKLLAEATVNRPDSQGQEHHHARNHRGEHFGAETDFKPGSELFHGLKAWAN